MSGRSKCITHELHWHYKEIWLSKVHVERYPNTMYKCHYEVPAKWKSFVQSLVYCSTHQWWLWPKLKIPWPWGLEYFTRCRHSPQTNTSWTFFLFIFDGGRVPPNGENGLWSEPSGLPTGGRHICLLNFFTSTVFAVVPSFCGVWIGIECCARMGAGFTLDVLLTWERSCNDFLMSLSSLRVKSEIKHLNL